MPLAVINQPFDHPDWLFELKYDGFRAHAYIEGGSVRLVSRNGNAYKSFPNLCRDMAGCINVRDAVLDGEIVYLDGAGKPQFYSLLRRRSPQQFISFDLLWLNGKDLRSRPLLERKRALRSIITAGSSMSSLNSSKALVPTYFGRFATAILRASSRSAEMDGTRRMKRRGSRSGIPATASLKDAASCLRSGKPPLDEIYPARNPCVESAW